MNTVSGNNGSPSPLPFKAADLDGLMIGEAFQNFVFGDPAVQAAGKNLIAEDSIHREIFADGHFPGLTVDFIWPVGVSADAVTYGFASLASPIVNHREVTNAMQRAGAIIADRWGALVKFLAAGEVEAVAAEGAIPKGQWYRRNISVDIQNHDLVEEGRQERRWTGLALSVAVPATTTTPPQSAAVKARPKDSDIATQLKSVGLEGGRNGLTDMQIVNKIGSFGRLTNDELDRKRDAMRKQVKRYYDRRGLA